MSGKTKRHKTNTESHNMEMSSGSVSVDSTAKRTLDSISSTAKSTLDTVSATVSNNKLLIGSIAAGCGAAIFLFTTDSGKRMRTGIQDRTVDLYDLVSEQVTNSWDQLRDYADDMMSSSEVEEATTRVRRAA